MSMHDSQLDSVNSTPEVRTHFALGTKNNLLSQTFLLTCNFLKKATLPIFAALGTLATVCYGTALMPVMAKLASVGILGGLQICNNYNLIKNNDNNITLSSKRKYRLYLLSFSLS